MIQITFPIVSHRKYKGLFNPNITISKAYFYILHVRLKNIEIITITMFKIKVI